MCIPPTNALVGQAASQIVAANYLRRGIFLRNVSNKTVWIAFDHDAEVDKGIVLYSKESYSMTPDDFSFSFVSAISDGDNSLVCIQEFSALGACTGD